MADDDDSINAQQERASVGCVVKFTEGVGNKLRRDRDARFSSCLEDFAGDDFPKLLKQFENDISSESVGHDDISASVKDVSTLDAPREINALALRS